MLKQTDDPDEVRRDEESLADGAGGAPVPEVAEDEQPEPRLAGHDELMALHGERPPLRVPVPALGPGVVIELVAPTAASEFGRIFDGVDRACENLVPECPVQERGPDGQITTRKVPMKRGTIMNYVWLEHCARLADGKRLSLNDIVVLGERTGMLMVNLGGMAIDHALATGSGVVESVKGSGGAEQAPPTTKTTTENETETPSPAPDGDGTSVPATTIAESSPPPA